MYVDAFNFQAAPFYQKLGFIQFGVLDDFPPGAQAAVSLQAVRRSVRKRRIVPRPAAFITGASAGSHAGKPGPVLDGAERKSRQSEPGEERHRARP